MFEKNANCKLLWISVDARSNPLANQMLLTKGTSLSNLKSSVYLQWYHYIPMLLNRKL